MDLTKLREPFPPADIEWRVAQSGKNAKGVWCKVLAYMTARAVMDRFDDVCGPENWRNEFKEAPGGGVLCGLSIRIGDEWVTKWDGAQQTDIEAVKGGLSGATKRAAVQWGCGRYLYHLPETWADTSTTRENGWNYAKTKDGTAFYWKPPALPSWAVPDGTPQAAPTGQPTQSESSELRDAVDAIAGPTEAQTKTHAAFIEYLDDAATKVQARSVCKDANKAAKDGNITASQRDHILKHAKAVAAKLPEGE